MRRSSSRARSLQLVALAGLAGLIAPSMGSCSGGDGDDGGDGGGGSVAEFCADLRAYETLQTDSDELLDDPETPVEQLRDVFARFSAAIDELEASAPEEVDADVQLVGETTQQLIEAYEAADFDAVRLATDPDYAEVLAGVDEVRVTEANDRLAVFVREQC